MANQKKTTSRVSRKRPPLRKPFSTQQHHEQPNEPEPEQNVPVQNNEQPAIIALPPAPEDDRLGKIIDISLQKKKAKGLHAFGFSTKPLEAPIDGDVTMKVHVAVAGTVKLTVQKTMGKRPKSLLARDRIMPVNHPIEKPVLEKKQEEKATKAKRELIRLRAKENPIFVVGSGGNHLWCTGCGGIVSPKSAHIKDHVATKKHKQALVKNSEEIASSKKSRDFIAEYFKASHEAGEKIDLKTLNFRFDTLTEFLRNGTLYQHTVHPSLFVDLTEYLLL
jgi:hypothetical protein